MESTPARQNEITRLLAEVRGGRREAVDRLFPLVYDELRRIARRHLRRERTGHTLRTTALVHEAYLGLVLRGEEDEEWHDRAHFMAVASTAMRHILIDHARHRGRQKRGGGRVPVTLREELVVTEESTDQLLALDEALTRLGRRDPRLEKVVVYRFFGGMTVDEAAEALDVSRRTVERDWTRARAYLYRELAS